MWVADIDTIRWGRSAATVAGAAAVVGAEGAVVVVVPPLSPHAPSSRSNPNTGKRSVLRNPSSSRFGRRGGPQCRRPCSEGRLTAREAGDLARPPEGHHSCGTAPESHRTSLLRPCRTMADAGTSQASGICARTGAEDSARERARRVPPQAGPCPKRWRRRTGGAGGRGGDAAGLRTVAAEAADVKARASPQVRRPVYQPSPTLTGRMRRNLSGAVIALLVAAMVAAFRRRPVKQPRAEGTWQPVHE